MPRMDGIETLNQIKKNPEKYGNPKVVMLSNIGGDIAIDKAMELGADGYMLKSETEPDDFVNVVTKYLE
jgi:DNA-binding NarL/FixJ family response regulator